MSMLVVDVTGSVEFSARVALEAFRHGKDVVLINPELDAMIGPILLNYADRHGVIVTDCEGDGPGLQMYLYRWVKGLGLAPRLLGNVKGLQDRYRNPTTQQGFGEHWDQNTTMVTSRRIQDQFRAGCGRKRHLAHFEMPNAIARTVPFRDP